MIIFASSTHIRNVIRKPFQTNIRELHVALSNFLQCLPSSRSGLIVWNINQQAVDVNQ